MRVLILNSERTSTQKLAQFFTQRGDQVWKTNSAPQVRSLLTNQQPDLVFVDLHMPGNEWLDVLNSIQKEMPGTQVIVTNRTPDIRREMQAKERGARVFLREPFTPKWIERALQNLAAEAPTARPLETQRALPPVRVPIRYKITIPYALLAMLFAFAAFYLGSRFVLESIHERFVSQLVDAGFLAADWMVKEEERILGNLRYLANTQGLAEAIRDRDTKRLGAIALPVAVNYQEEAIEILDINGISLLSLRRRPDGAPGDYTASWGDASLADLGFVAPVLSQQVDALGDKYAGLGRMPWGDYFYIAGPVFDEQNQPVGAIAVGKSVGTLARQIRQDTLAQVTIYTTGGEMLASTVLVPDEVPPLAAELHAELLNRQAEDSMIRDMRIASLDYSEVLGAWEARGGQDLGVMGISLSENYLANPTTVIRFQAFIVVAFAFVGVILLGIYLARQVTTPLSQIVKASQRVAQGDLAVKVPVTGDDEVTVLAHAFNHMISRLQEGFIYRDLLGRAVSPEVREALRNSFASGNIRLEGQSAVATVLMSDIRGFTALSEKEAPTTILTWLNEYYSELVPVITAHGGVVDKFEGDAMLAFFGLLPAPLPPEESALQACCAAVEMISAVEQINARRVQRDDPPLTTGIGVHTGMLTAGSLGTADRMNFTIIGDTVNTTERIQGITSEFGESAVVISENTLEALQGQRGTFRCQPLGEHTFKGKLEMLWLYRIWKNGEEQETASAWRSVAEETMSADPR